MWKLTFIIFVGFCGQAQAQSLCQTLQGAYIIANDGTMLGKISSSFDNESILNEFGSYGGEFSSNSIWNEFGSYGGEFSSLSPFNKFTSTPPLIVMDGKAVAYLSVTKRTVATVNPYFLKSCE